jgi:glutathione S-transferase
MRTGNYRLVIGNRNYSSWSLRAWLFLKESGIPFEEIRIPLFTTAWDTEISQYSPAGRVPVLLDGDISVWDSMAIFQYILERHAGAVGWPEPDKARAVAQSISFEMHSGFLAVRDELPQNIRARRKRDLAELSEACVNQIERIDLIWSECRREYGEQGPWLFGALSLADIMFAPVALRFVTYQIPISDAAAQFQRAICDLPTVQHWIAAANEEPEAIAFIDDHVPAAESPLTLG